MTSIFTAICQRNQADSIAACQSLSKVGLDNMNLVSLETQYEYQLLHDYLINEQCIDWGVQ